MTRSIDFTMVRRARRIAALTLACAALGMPALVQAQSTSPSTPPSAAPQQGQRSGSMTASDAFKRADANQDGKLSKDELAAIPGMSAKFDAWDKDKDGTVTMTEFSAGYAVK